MTVVLATALPATASPATEIPPSTGTGSVAVDYLATRTVAAVFEAVAANIGHLVVPLLALLAMQVFFAVQNRMDRRDPKLAAAPLTRDRFMYFDEHGTSAAPLSPVGTGSGGRHRIGAR
ncbi:hypothetical protein AB0G04_18415 [Actinoplanes sp. NPDC023801]|uniref:hypothetical protein n=1 Tax=Actinoplanes sp. NPDC023801 TaxID=3154595 RepID=UPI0033ED464E